MQELIALVSSKTGLSPEKAEKALGIMLSLVKSQGNQNRVGELFDRLPGADELAAKHGASGLMGKLLGGAMGGPLAAVAKLQSAGLSMDQIKSLGNTTLDYAKQKAGADLVKQVAGSIPGLGGYI